VVQKGSDVVKSPALSGIIFLAALGLTGARAQTDLNAGMTPSQLFAANCTACHRSPQGLARGRDPYALAGFLRDHYTTRPTTAGAIAGYLASIRGVAPPPRPPAAQDPAAGAGAGTGTGDHAVQSPRTPSARPLDRLANATVERLKTFAVSADPAKPAEANAPERSARLSAYAASGVPARALRETAIEAAMRNGQITAGRDARVPGASAIPVAAPHEKPAPAVARDGKPAPRSPSVAAGPALLLQGPPTTSATPSAQSNEDAR
jgi:hypothetical protein